MLNDKLSQFNGTEYYYKHPMYPNFRYTDGIKFFAETYKAHWILDFIFSNQLKPKVGKEPFQIWLIKVNEDNSCVITCKEDSDQPNLLRHKIDYTDLPDSIQLYFIDGVLLLPSEY